MTELFDPMTRTTARGTTRRKFLGLAGGIAAETTATGLGLNLFADQASGAADSDKTLTLLQKSEFVYISPLLAPGKESTCHAELWFAWLDDRIVVNVARDRWKAAALARGHKTARVWVGDHGRWKGWLGTRNEAFRKAPNFIARVERIDSQKSIERLLSIYEKKYRAEIDDWRDSMRQGVADGSRILLGYRIKV